MVGKAGSQPIFNRQPTKDRAMNHESAVQFQTNSRIHLGLAVKNLEQSMAFYRTLFGQEPTKTRPRYAKFEVAEPPVNLALNEVGGDTGPNNPVAHFGIQVKSREAVGEVAVRLRGAGLETAVEDNVTCCYAVQSKVWATDPDGNKWEVYVVLDNEGKQYYSTQTACCADRPDCCEDKAACCTALPESEGTVKTNDQSCACACPV
jgi:catechol 2,3-dioxygenase-like lactoylglutathione lyase family enzyme